LRPVEIFFYDRIDSITAVMLCRCKLRFRLCAPPRANRPGPFTRFYDLSVILKVRFSGIALCGPNHLL